MVATDGRGWHNASPSTRPTSSSGNRRGPVGPGWPGQCCEPAGPVAGEPALRRPQRDSSGLPRLGERYAGLQVRLEDLGVARQRRRPGSLAEFAERRRLAHYSSST